MKPNEFNVAKHRCFAKWLRREILNYFYDKDGNPKQSVFEEYAEWHEKTYGFRPEIPKPQEVKENG